MKAAADDRVVGALESKIKVVEEDIQNYQHTTKHLSCFFSQQVLKCFLSQHSNPKLSLNPTWQLVKNTFLKNERTLSRKMVEAVLSLALERTLLKGEILSCYMSKIYWGHGIYGIESASKFYFGKHPSLLSLGESAFLAGLIPAPELQSPLRDASRGKTFRARVLKRMVEVGFLDIRTALLVVKQFLPLQLNDAEANITFLPAGGTDSIFKDIWDWESESKVWEACEDMERWATEVRRRTCKALISLLVVRTGVTCKL